MKYGLCFTYIKVGKALNGFEFIPFFLFFFLLFVVVCCSKETKHIISSKEGETKIICNNKHIEKKKPLFYHDERIKYLCIAGNLFCFSFVFTSILHSFITAQKCIYVHKAKFQAHTHTYHMRNT